MLANTIVIKKIYLVGVFSVAILGAIVGLFPIAFSAIQPHYFFTNLAYFITQSGGPIGTFILLLITGLAYTHRRQELKGKIFIFFKAFLSLLLLLTVFGFLNEHYTKTLLKAERPSHQYMLKQAQVLTQIDSLYALSKAQRAAYFQQLIQTNLQQFIWVDPRVQSHWIKESGYSFPSGHSFNAFLFAMILCYALYFNASHPWAQKLFFMPFVWAICVAVSRVCLGVHSPLDVTAGASLGVLVGGILLYIEKTRHWLTQH